MGDSENERIVAEFLTALREKDFATAGKLLDDDLVYENVGFPTVRGGRRTIKLFEALTRMGFDVAVHRTATDGDTVLNERTDVLSFGPVRVQFWVCGTFELHDGRITLWRDHFDVFDLTKAIGRGLAGAVVPALRPSFSDAAR
ncbi:limonene-1,2-epoxide hydrolase family protein [Antrihabitans cavernicola]|uniref:Limonene-1,2-epoxide hydrolase n=1 Tax=Antrihabitans cavernicola TaxID=2495913 RepID=A0A5A7SDL5_9NOCA|nr:limonene-1,2-epoxide hydrolase family protein [Spelaeibacter cavernicola]KAA0023282.1 limonene-1,2-epoxide hydrolase [Spelaeibacter cavernicola]